MRRLVVLLLGSTGLVASPALAADARYAGTFNHTDGNTNQSTMQHRYDWNSRGATYGNLKYRLRFNLSHLSQPGIRDSDVLRTRLDGDLRGRIWRLGGTFVPWQNVSSGPLSPRERSLQLNLELRVPNAPSLRVHVTRRDQDRLGDRSSSEDRRIDLSHRVAGVDSRLSFRQIDVNPAGSAADSQTREWRLGLGGAPRWRGISTNVTYDAGLSRVERSATSRQTLFQRTNASARWSPRSNLSLSSSTYLRWSQVEDSTLDSGFRSVERSLSGVVSYRPLDGLSLLMSRNYRINSRAETNAVFDYLRMQGVFSRRLRRSLTFQTAVSRNVDLADTTGAPARNSAQFLVDGRLRRGMSARAEVTVSSPNTANTSGNSWQRTLQIRTVPGRWTRVDASWRLSTYPRLGNSPRTDRTLELVLAYRPASDVDVSGSYRRTDARGGIDRGDRTGTVTSSWRFSDRSQLSFTWSQRSARLNEVRTSASTSSLSLAFWLPGELKSRASVQRISGTTRSRTTTYGLNVERRF